MEQTYTQYGAEVSLFSGKTRAYLRYKSIPFNEVLATADVVNNVLYPNTNVRMIPVVKTPEGEFLQDTTAIIDHLETQFPTRSIYPSTPKQHWISLWLELYADEWLLLPAMHYRWHYKRAHLGFILKEFGACAMPKWPKILQPLAGLVPAFYFGRLYKPVLGISKRNRSAIETWYERFLRDFDEHLVDYYYLLGSAPSIADFGFFGPLYAHLYRDPYSGELMREKAPRVAQWVERMRDPNVNSVNTFIEDDAIPASVLPFLRHQVATQLPVLQETLSRVSARALRSPDKKIPRFLGTVKYQIEGVSETRFINSYAQWMLQRPIAYFKSLTKSQQLEIVQWAKSVGLEALTSIEITTPIERRDNLLYPAKT